MSWLKGGPAAALHRNCHARYVILSIDNSFDHTSGLAEYHVSRELPRSQVFILIWPPCDMTGGRSRHVPGCSFQLVQRPKLTLVFDNSSVQSLSAPGRLILTPCHWTCKPCGIWFLLYSIGNDGERSVWSDMPRSFRS